jgi:anti-anti-sigma regulatory factor
MPEVLATSAGGTHVLPADLRIAVAAPQRDALLAAAAAGPVLTIDGSAVTRVDATGLQLLVAACRHQQERGGTVRWAGVSEALRAAAAHTGLTEILCFPRA